MRISRHNMFMDIARIVAKRGTCPRLCVGAVVVRDCKKIVSIGYNGAPPGKPHCTEVGCLMNGVSCIRADHAEFNALREYVELVDYCLDNRLSLYVTHSPCEECARYIVKARVKSVYFETPYKSIKGLTILTDNDVKVFRVMPNGYIIEGSEGKLIEVN